MGQTIYKAHLQTIDSTDADAESSKSDLILLNRLHDDIQFLIPQNDAHELFESSMINRPFPLVHVDYIKNIRQHIDTVTMSSSWTRTKEKSRQLIAGDLLKSLVDYCGMTDNELNEIKTKCNELKLIIQKKCVEDESESQWEFGDLSNDDQTQLSYFAIQSMISIVLLLIRSAEKNDPHLIHQILSLAEQITEQLPIKSLSKSKINPFLLKSLQPLINYIQDLTNHADMNLASQARMILLLFAMAKGSFKDVLPLLKIFIFDTKDDYRVSGLIRQLKRSLDNLMKQRSLDDQPSNSLTYLNEIESYLTNNKKEGLKNQIMSGRMLASVILAHVDLQAQDDLMNPDTLAFEFHSNTFQQLFSIIEQLSSNSSSVSITTVEEQILFVSLRLFQMHLRYLSMISLSSDAESHSIVSNELLTQYTNHDDLECWYTVLLKIAMDATFKKSQINERASKALMAVIELRSSIFADRLSVLHSIIIDNQSSSLVKQCFIQLAEHPFVCKWLDSFLQEENTSTGSSYQLLECLLKIYFNDTTNHPNEDIEQILSTFQKNLLTRLLQYCGKTDPLTNVQQASFDQSKARQLCSVVVRYITLIFDNLKKSTSLKWILSDDLILGIFMVCQVDQMFHYDAVEPILTTSLVLVADYYFEILNKTSDIDQSDRMLICLLVGNISQALIQGSPSLASEIRHHQYLKSSLFAGGCSAQNIRSNNDFLNLIQSNLASYSEYSSSINDENSPEDHELLMCIYDQREKGAQLVNKLKELFKSKYLLLQKSIEQFASTACAQVFAVYVKHYRRINLAKYEVNRSQDSLPHPQLRSLYEYATRVISLLATVKAQGDDCEQFCRQIQERTSFLLLTVKENPMIPIIDEIDNKSTLIVNPTSKNTFKLNRQVSRWSKAKHVLKLLRHLFQACVRFKRLMVERKKSIQKIYDFEIVTNRTIEQFLYGEPAKLNKSQVIEDKVINLDELNSCLIQQHRRALTRLLTYRFGYVFIEKLLKTVDSAQGLSVYLPFLRGPESNWSYFNHIEASNTQIKKDISDTYLSIIRSVMIADKISIEDCLHMINYAYNQMDFTFLLRYQYLESICNTFLGWKFESNPISTIYIVFQWFRSFIFQLCLQIEIENLQHMTLDSHFHHYQEEIFRRFIFNQLIQWQDHRKELAISTDENPVKTLRDIDCGWFIKAIKTNVNVPNTSFDLELLINQYLILLLRALQIGSNVVRCCSKFDYVEILLKIYHDSSSTITQILALKILRHLIFEMSSQNNGSLKLVLEAFLRESMQIIGESTPSKTEGFELVTELIALCRSMMSVKCDWQMMTIELVAEPLLLYLNPQSINSIDKNQRNQLSASLSILGAYIQPFHVGALVKILTDEETNDDNQIGFIVEIDSTTSVLNEDDSYTIQYIQTNQYVSISEKKLKVETDVLPPNFDVSNTIMQKLLDNLVSFVQFQADDDESLGILRIQRQCTSILQHILRTKDAVELFMSKSYSHVLAELSLPNHSQWIYKLPQDLIAFDRQNYEQYLLILNRNDQKYDRKNQSFSTPADGSHERKLDPAILVALSSSDHLFWKPCMFQEEFNIFNTGRFSEGELRLVTMPQGICQSSVLRECGNRHKFLGQIYPTYQNTNVSFPTFIVDRFRVTDGKWYFCVRLTTGGVVQIGWATHGFKPGGSTGVGDDKYSWSYDGSRRVLFNDRGFYNQLGDHTWRNNDVCGCGIEIDGDRSNIKYWLNGEFLGTAFRHQREIDDEVNCDLFPNGPSTSFFPAVTIQRDSEPTKTCDLIFHPDDMNECPLPYGYKPLISPTIVRAEHPTVSYPSHAYLIGNNHDDYFVRRRLKSNAPLLRDFINGQHLETAFSLDEGSLVLPKDGSGLSLSIDVQDLSALTISYDYQRVTDDETVDVVLCTIESSELVQVPLTLDRSEQGGRIVIVINLTANIVQVYNSTITKQFTVNLIGKTQQQLNMKVLPKSEIKLKNLGIWKNALDDDNLQGLFKYGLVHVASDYCKLKQYRERVNRISFTIDQQEFLDETLLPFDDIFTETEWKTKALEATDTEQKYFKHDHGDPFSTVQIKSNQNYLVLKKPNEVWSDYCIIVEVLILQHPKSNKNWGIIELNSGTNISLTDKGTLCLEQNDNKQESNSVLPLNEFVRLIIAVEERVIQIYWKGNLEIEEKVTYDQLYINSSYIDLFRDKTTSDGDPTDDTLRFLLKSVAFMNRILPSETIRDISQSFEISMDKFFIAPSEILRSTSLIINYKETWIESMSKEKEAINLFNIEQMLRTQKQDLKQKDLEVERGQCLKTLSNSEVNVNDDKLREIISEAKFKSRDKIFKISDIINSSWFNNASQMKKDKHTIPKEETLTETDKTDWFKNAVSYLGIKNDLSCWIRDNASIIEYTDVHYDLLDLSHPVPDEKMIQVKKKKTSTIDKTVIGHLSEKECHRNRGICERGLIVFNARSIILQMLKIWSNNAAKRFPLESLADHSSSIQIIRLLAEMDNETNEQNNQSIELLFSIVQDELETIFTDCISDKSEINSAILESKAPFFYHLQRSFTADTIEYLWKAAVQGNSYQQESVDDESNSFSFFLSCLCLLVKLVRDICANKSAFSDAIVKLIFPSPLINLLFNLFIMIPKLDERCVILRAFSDLIRACNFSVVNSYHEDFFFRLLTELSGGNINTNTRSQHKLVLAMTDIVFALRLKYTQKIDAELLSGKQAAKFESKIKSLPESVRELYMTMDIISTILNRTKSSRIPETLLSYAKKNGIRYLKADTKAFENTNRIFTTVADQELLRFMNNDSTITRSFSNFLTNLPSGTEANSEFYKNYITLSTIPADTIRHRIEYIHLFNTLLQSIMSMIDLNLPTGQSFVTDQIRTMKMYLLNSTKDEMFNSSLSMTQDDYNSEWLCIDFHTVPINGDDSEEQTMFYQAYQQLHMNAHDIFRRSNDQLWRAQYVGMHSTDQGGPYRDSITRICSDICSTRLKLFILCPNGRTNTGLYRDCWLPNVFPPHKPILKKYKKQYRFVGQLIGMAIRKKHYLDLKLAPLVWKGLLKETITVEDIESIDQQSFTIIYELEKNIEHVISLGVHERVDFLFSSILNEVRFDVVNSAGETFELVPGGSNIPITMLNFKQYCSKYRRYRLEEFDRQIEFIRQGLYSVVPNYYLRLFTAKELEEAACGKSSIDVDLLKRNTNYGSSYNEETPVIERFWTVFRDMFTDEQKKLFLTFVWGRSTLPTSDEDFSTKFSITPYELYDSEANPNLVLPRSHTCFFTLDLPDYSTTEVLYERLNYAISCCSSIDGDGLMNETTGSARELGPDSDADEDWS